MLKVERGKTFFFRNVVALYIYSRISIQLYIVVNVTREQTEHEDK